MATSQAKIPAQIGNKCFIKTEKVKENIPFLMVKALLKKAGTVLNIRNDKVQMFNKDIDSVFFQMKHATLMISRRC